MPTPLLRPISRPPSTPRGKAARQETPRRSHATWEPWPGRPDPIDILEEQASHRNAELVPIRYGRMLASPLAFFRGSAAIMASDLATTPRSGLKAQCCGDAHLVNFGVFSAPDRSLVFDINDFDETLPGPWEWDVKRLAASFEIVMRDRGMDATARRAALLEIVRSYRETMLSFAEQNALDVWYARLDAQTVLGALQAGGEKRDARVLAKGWTRRSRRTAFAHWRS